LQTCLKGNELGTKLAITHTNLTGVLKKLINKSAEYVPSFEMCKRQRKILVKLPNIKFNEIRSAVLELLSVDREL
jgi:hypothetical protein